MLLAMQYDLQNLDGATLRPGIRNLGPETGTEIRSRNPEPETRIQNPDSTNQRKQVPQIPENYLA